MISKYLNANPIPWITDGADPAATYLAKNEFSEQSDCKEIYNDLEASALTGYFRNHSKANILGDKNNPDLVNRGTTWNFLWAVECGYDSRTDFIRETALFITENFSTPDGGFSLSLKPRTPLACRTGELVRALFRTGVSDERTREGLNWIACHQRNDGGWLHCPFTGFCDVMKMLMLKKAGNGIKRDNDSNIPSCPVATLSCIRALSDSGNTAYKTKIEEGAGFILQSSVLSSDDKLLHCGLNLFPKKSGYPLMGQFDSITALMEMFNTSHWNNPLCTEIFNNIMMKQTTRGTWKLENNSRGMIPAGKGENRLVTLNVIRMLKRLEKIET